MAPSRKSSSSSHSGRKSDNSEGQPKRSLNKGLSKRGLNRMKKRVNKPRGIKRQSDCKLQANESRARRPRLKTRSSSLIRKANEHVAQVIDEVAKSSGQIQQTVDENIVSVSVPQVTAQIPEAARSMNNVAQITGIGHSNESRPQGLLLISPPLLANGMRVHDVGTVESCQTVGTISQDDRVRKRQPEGISGQFVEGTTQSRIGSSAITGTTPVSERAGSRSSAGEPTLSQSPTFTLDDLSKVLQSLQVGPSPGNELNQVVAGWDSRVSPTSNVLGCAAGPSPANVTIGSTTVPVMGSAKGTNVHSQVSTPQTGLSHSAFVDVIPGNVDSGNSLQTEGWKSMMEKVQQTQASLLGELKRSESLIGELQLRAARPEFGSSRGSQRTPISGGGTGSGRPHQRQDKDVSWTLQNKGTTDPQPWTHYRRKSSVRTLRPMTRHRSKMSQSLGHKRRKARSMGSWQSMPGSTSSESSNDESNDEMLSEIDSDGSIDSEDDESMDSDDGARRRSGAPHNAKLIPPFTGNGEKWEVWLARFEAVATNHKWNKADRLSTLLPLLRKSASEYAFGTLNAKVRSSYRLLVKELTKRFRVVESVKSYQSKWSNLRQAPGQTEEELAAHIRWLHGKAYPGRDETTQREDMLLKFFEALSDRSARVAVEFTKKPRNIDVAVDCVVQYREIRKANRADDGSKYGRARAVRLSDDLGFWDESYEDDSREASIRAMKTDNDDELEPPRKKMKRDLEGEQQSGESQKELSKNSKAATNSQGSSKRRARSAKTDKSCYRCYKPGHFARDCKEKPGGSLRDRKCYQCHQEGHIAKNCPNGDLKSGGPPLPNSQPNPFPTVTSNPMGGQQPVNVSVPPSFQQPVHVNYPQGLQQPVMMMMPGSYPVAMSVGGLKADGTQSGRSAGSMSGGVGMAYPSRPSGGTDGSMPQSTN